MSEDEHSAPEDETGEPAVADALEPVRKLLDIVAEGFGSGSILAVLIALSIGSAVWPLFNLGLLRDAGRNALEWETRRVATGVSVGVSALVFAAYVAWVIVRVREGGDGGVLARVRDAVSTLNARFSVVLVLPLLVHALSPRVAKDHPATVVFFCAIGAVVVGHWVKDLPALTDDRLARFWDWTRRPELQRWFWAGTVGLTLFWALFFSWRSIVAHHGFQTQVYDLGLYDQIFYQSVRGNFLACTFMNSGVHHSAHFDPILVFLSPLHLLHPDATTLLVLQAFWIASGAIPLHWLAARTSGSGAVGLLMAAVYVLYPAPHGITLYDFHSLALAIPLLIWVVALADSGHKKTYWVLVVLALLVREDVSLVLATIGGALLIGQRGPRELRWQGALTIVVSLLYFLVVKKAVMVSDELLNCSKGGTCFAYYFKDLIVQDKGGIEIPMTMLSHPGYVLQVMTQEKKLLYLAQLFVPVLGLAFYVRGWRWMMLYGMTFTLLASKEPVFEISFQYSTVLFPVALALTAIALGQISRGEGVPRWWSLKTPRTLAVLGGAMLTASLMMTLTFGGLVPNAGFKAGWGPLRWSVPENINADRLWLKDQLKALGDDAKLSVTRRLAPQVSARAVAKQFGAQSDEGVDYIIIHRRDLTGKRKRRLDKLRKMEERGEIERVDSHGDIEIYRRR